MQQAHQAARVADRLAEPEHGLAVALARVLGQRGVLRQALRLVDGRDGEDEQQGQRGARDEGEHLRVLERVDVVHLQRGAEAQRVQQAAHQLRVRLERDEGRGASRWIGIG